ncbi:MAG: SusC/RagA family TonB-linked outer membrane protein [Tannerella sp.]|jgi:TonB-linked SusC/RagA family outer membrane protein|nr:SusC/RagA family TonB-linked outer membrane protein [Tannerella sp.]
MKKKLTNGMKDAKFEWMKRGMILSVLLFVMGTGMVFAADGYPPEANEPEQSSARIRGTVVDEAGEPVVGANVVVKGRAGVGTVTDQEGRFSLQVAADTDLEISFIGYLTQTVKAADNMTVTLAEDALALDEVVVTALGITREAKALGYAVTTISAKELTKVGSPNVATALYGKASGVRIQNTQGGSAGGVSIAVRGLSSFNGNTQPLIVMNGVPIRNGNANNSSNAESSNLSDRDFASIGAGDRIRSNGIVDINPEDIESLTILKGAAATALYGSEAANGAIIITSKRSTAKGVTVDVNASFQVNQIANVPKTQSTYGPGETFNNWDDNFKEGFRTDAVTGKQYPNYNSRFSWGPAYDGREVLYIDGATRAYSPYSSEPWKDLFRDGSTQVYNVAINQGGDKSNTRFSYTYAGEVPNALSGSYNKHNFNMVGTLKFNDRLSVDYTGNYIVQNFKNRSQASVGVYGSWSDAFGSFVDIPLIRSMYKTADGYLNAVGGNGWTPAEYATIDAVNGDQFVNGVRSKLLWNIFENQSEEVERRLIASVVPSWKATDWLTVKARIATDYTGTEQEERNRSQYPATARPNPNDNVTGAYTTLQKSYQIIYGDVMLLFDKKLTDEIQLNANLGWQGRTEKMNAVFVGTNGGLAIDNVFQITNGKRGTISPDANTNRKMELLKTAFVGTVGVSYGGYAFLDLTGRQEKSSTLPKGNRDYFYPSASASFLFSEAFDMPVWNDFGKVRLSYGIVGNAPEAYAASMAYVAKSDPGGFIYNQIPSNLGNTNLKPETTREFEVGLEGKFLKNRLGLEVSYYSREISDMLFQVPLAPSSGSNDVWTNSGTMTNSGVEATVYGTPVQTRDFAWELRTNIGFNKNKIDDLAAGVLYIQHGGLEGNIGYTRSYVGSAMGDYVSSKYITVQNDDPSAPYYDASGQYVGRRVVNAEGNYLMSSTLETVGNALPKVVGGLGTSLSYKNLSLDIMTDFRWGGHVFNRMYYLTMNTGISTDTENREGEGFYDYTSSRGVTRKIGIILDGVVADGNGGFTENKEIIPYDTYTMSAFGIGNYGAVNQTASNALFENNWWKVREIALSYSFPKSLLPQKVFQNLTLSVFGRNLFYLYKSIPHYDPETSNGTDWKSQLVIGSSAAPNRSFGLSLRATF